MIKRIVSSFFLLLISIFPIYYGGLFLDIFVTFFALFSVYEFTKIRNKNFNYLLYLIMEIFIFSLLAFPKNHIGLILLFLFFLFVCAIFSEDINFIDVSSCFALAIALGFAIVSIYRLYVLPGYHFHFVYIILATYGCDIGAYFFGKKFGKHKLIERISPKKTIEGSIGGWLLGFLVSFLYVFFFQKFMINSVDINFYFFFSLLLPVVSQIGDLSFSLVKRNYNVKDFGSIIPGHGGVLDRIDSLIFTLITFTSLLGFLLI